MAVMSESQVAAELQRKKNLGIAPTSSVNQAAYGKLTAQPISANTAGVTAAPGAAAGAIAGLPNSSVPQTPNGYTSSGNAIADALKYSGSTLPGAAAGSGISIPTAAPSAPAPAPTAQTPTVTAQPMSAQQTQQAAPDYATMAAARTALALQQKTTIANQQKTAAQTSYDQQNLRTKDDRVLGDFSRTQTANPFGNMGRKSFQEGLIGRERTQADADASAALATQKGNIDALLADYQNATAEEQVRIADELERADRSYNLDLAKFNQDKSNSDRNFNQSQQQIDYAQSPSNPNNVGQALSNVGQSLNNQLSELKLGNYSAEQKQQATLYEQQVAAGKMSNEAAAYNLAQLKDPNSASNQAAKIDLQLKQLDLKNAPEAARLKLQQLQKEIAQIGVVHYKPQTAAEIAQDKVTLATANKQLTDIANGKYPGDKSTVVKPTTSEEYQSNLKPQYDKYGKITNTQQIEDQIILSGMSEWEQYKSYIANGIAWTDPIPNKPS